MRWDSQRVDASGQQPLPGLPGLVRSVRTPEFAGVTFHEVRAKSVLNRVPGGSLPFGWTVNPYRGCTHGCTYCLAGDTPVLAADGRVVPLADLRIGDAIYGTERVGNYRRYVLTQVLAHWSTRRTAYRVTLADGTQLIAGAGHRLLTRRGWRTVGEAECRGLPARLAVGDTMVGTGRFATPPKEGVDYQCGYLTGLVSGGGARRADPRALERARAFLTGTGSLSLPIEQPATPNDEWCKGFLAGVFDVDGGSRRGAARVGGTGVPVVDTVCAALRRFGFGFAVDPPGHAGGRHRIRLLGGLAEYLRLTHTIGPAVPRSGALVGRTLRSTARLRVDDIEPLGLELPLFDITTGTGDFIANGVVSHNCFARNSHTYLDFDAGSDFDSQIVVKVNAPEVLAKQLRAPGWAREQVAMGTNTDPYQRAEGRYQLMPGIIGALAGSGTPFSVLTKGTVLARDLPLLASAGQDVEVGLGVSIALLDRELQRGLEPGTPSPQARLELVRRITEAGLPCGVMVAPVLPYLTDSTEQLDQLLAAVADAGASSATVLPLHLRPGAREWFAGWLAREHPELVEAYRQCYARGSYAAPAYRRWLSARVGPLLRRHRLDGSERRLRRSG